MTNFNPHFVEVKHIQFLVVSFDAAIFMLKLNCKQFLCRVFKRKSQRSNKVYSILHWTAERITHDILNPHVPKHSAIYITYLPTDTNFNILMGSFA